MAKIQTVEVIDHLEDQIRKALAETLREHFPDQGFTARAVYKTFIKQVEKKCNSWEDIPNKYVRA